MSIERVKDAAEHVKLTREMFDLFSQVRLPDGDPAKPLYAVSDIKVGELPALELMTDLSAAFAAGAKNGPPEVTEMFRSMFAKLFGGDGEMRAYMAIADEHTCVTAYSKELLQRGVDHVRSGKPGLEADATITKTGALLPEGSQWTAYISPQGVIQWVNTLLKQLPAELNFRLPPFPASDPIGAAARVKPDGLDAELVLPDTVIAGIGQYVGLIQQMMQGGGQLP